MSTLVDEYAPWSISKSDLAGKCPYAFYLRYLERVPRAEGTHAKIGVTAHRAQELVLRDKMSPVTAVEQAIAESPALTHSEMEAVRALTGNIGMFFSRMEKFKERHGVTEEFFEQKWAVNRDFKRTDYDAPDAFFRGIVDYAMITSSNYLIVIDHKSGRRHPVDYYARQLDSYAVLGAAEMPQVKGVHASLHYMKSRDLDWHEMRKIDVISSMLVYAQRDLLTRRANDLVGFAPKVNKFCKWCDYLAHCETGKASLPPEKPKRVSKKQKKDQCL